MAKAAPSLDEQIRQADTLQGKLRGAVAIVERIGHALTKLPPLADIERRTKAAEQLVDRLAEVHRLAGELPPLAELQARGLAVGDLAATLRELPALWAQLPTDEAASDLDRTARRLGNELEAVIALIPKLPTLDELQQLADALPPPPAKKGK